MQDPKPQTPSRVVHCEDAIAWLERQKPLEAASVITSLPDHSEFARFTLEQWKDWFVSAVELTLSRVPEDGVAIFYQTDIKKDGAWVDKGYLCQKAAERAGHALLWHKLVCRGPAGNISYGRPGYSHMLCFSRGVRVPIADSTADLLPEAGEVTWTRGMGIKACQAAVRFVTKHSPGTRAIVDPFCGHGTVLAVANELGLDAVGVELGAKRARIARTLTVKDVVEPSQRPPAGVDA